MTTDPNNIPVSIDYTSRDYYSLRNDIISRIKKNVPTWLGTDPADFGVALVEAFAYMGDIANYYIDRVANESMVSTATQRSSLIDYARATGYTVDGYRAATLNLKFGNSGATGKTLPAGTVVFADIVANNEVKRIKFITDNSVTVPANTSIDSSTISTTATQGYPLATAVDGIELGAGTGIWGKQLSKCTGNPNQVYALNDGNVIDTTLRVFIYDNNAYVEWTRVKDFTLYGRSDRVFTAALDDNDFLNITFGDGVSGVIPSSSSFVFVSYVLGDGVYGNILPNTILKSISSLSYVPGANSLNDYTSVITVTNDTSGVGGANPESNSSIRRGAESAAGTVSRAVTLKDYENLALLANNLGKVKAYSNNLSTVTLYVAPKRGYTATPWGVLNATDKYPGWNTNKTATTTEMLNLLDNVSTTLEPYSQIGVTVTTAPAYYSQIYISYTYNLVPGFSSDDVTATIKARLFDVFSYQNMRIQGTITAEQILKEIISIPGVSTATVTNINRNSTVATPPVLSVTGLVGEIFVLDTVDATTVQSVLTDLKLEYPAGTEKTPDGGYNLANRFSYSYTVSGANGLKITPTSTGNTITVGGSIVSSGTSVTYASGFIKVGANSIPVVVTGPNGDKKTYNLSIFRAS